MPRSLRPTRTCGSLRIAAATRALASPVWPPQAPQSRPEACGLFTVVLPWPVSITSRAKVVGHRHGAQNSLRHVHALLVGEAGLTPADDPRFDARS